MTAAVERIGIIVIGDELLSGKRRDRHFEHVLEVTAPLGLQVAWVRLLGDDAAELTAQFRQTMAEGIPVFSFGGIGATPDDMTRQAAAAAAGVAIGRHDGAVAEIEARFGEAAYPHRIRMAELPEGSELIPNPVNRIPGFIFRNHYFLPGFPEMAWPMLDWALEQDFARQTGRVHEYALKALGAHESELLPMMESLVAAHPMVKFFCLPRLGEDRHLELGFRGREGAEAAYADLKAALERRQIPYEEFATS